MSKAIDDMKTDLKGVRGAGDAIPGSVMEATGQAFDSEANHPQTQVSQEKNHAIAVKGKHDVKETDKMLAREEQEHALKHTLHYQSQNDQEHRDHEREQPQFMRPAEHHTGADSKPRSGSVFVGQPQPVHGEGIALSRQNTGSSQVVDLIGSREHRSSHHRYHSSGVGAPEGKQKSLNDHD